ERDDEEKAGSDGGEKPEIDAERERANETRVEKEPEEEAERHEREEEPEPDSQGDVAENLFVALADKVVDPVGDRVGRAPRTHSSICRRAAGAGWAGFRRSRIAPSVA